MNKQIRIAVDYENSAETWWDAARRDAFQLNGRYQFRDLIVGPIDKMIVDAQDANYFRAWCETKPGWSDGPTHAPHPFTFSPPARAEDEPIGPTMGRGFYPDDD